jgi:hypothetical protein
MKRRVLALVVGTALAALAAPTLVVAAPASGAPTAASGSTTAYGASPLFRFALDSDLPGRCANGATDNGTNNGFVVVVRQGNAPYVYVYVVLRNAPPETTMFVNRSCVGPIGSFKTDIHGNGSGFFVDYFPPGANRFVYDVLKVPNPYNPIFSTNLITLKSDGTE